jgi:hypothetical protein
VDEATRHVIREQIQFSVGQWIDYAPWRFDVYQRGRGPSSQVEAAALSVEHTAVHGRADLTIQRDERPSGGRPNEDNQRSQRLRSGRLSREEPQPCRIPTVMEVISLGQKSSLPLLLSRPIIPMWPVLSRSTSRLQGFGVPFRSTWLRNCLL